MTLQLDISANPEVDELILEHSNRPMAALREALMDTTNHGIEFPMAIIMDRRCGIERRAEVADGQYNVGASPLLMAINTGRHDVGKALLAAGADPNVKDSNGDNSLMAATHVANLGSIEFLISYGADINSVDKHCKTALHYAAYWGHASVIELLERSGANLEAVDNEGRAPLHIAAFSCEDGAIKALLQLGANQAAVDNEGRTPRQIAVDHSNVETIEAFRDAMWRR